MMLCLLIFMTALLGQYCAENINECLTQSNACHNGGTCIDTDGGHVCVCVNGWTGDDCSENIDDCAAAACFNGATCHDRVASFYCECPVGKTGLLCHLDDACLSNPCGEGAVCDTNIVSGQYICIFPSGSVREVSDHDKDEYSIVKDANKCLNECYNGGSCVDINGGHACVCVNGWTGDDCSENIDDCATAVCFNGATCHDRVASFYCECPVGKTGLLCHLDDACLSNPCGEGAVCDTNPLNGRYICTFPSGSVAGA